MSKEEKSGLDAIGKVPICAACGSERVVRDAWACWNREAGLWELENSFDAAFCHNCERETKLKWTSPDEPPNLAVRDLNDAFRKMGTGKGTVLVTPGVSDLGSEAVSEIVAKVQAFETFTEANDPWGEHDFGAIELGDQKVFWKIDPYDLDLKYHSPNPANPAVTHRVLTIMLASEY